ncbi:Mss4-like protein [Xylaria sp. FL0064]|nr:Mss4-like protein [Xylaria sp. FL0064]
MPPLPGGCYCGAIRYTIMLSDPASEARTSICHCGNCKRFTGCNYDITTKIPRSSFALAGVKLHREFCGTWGGSFLEYGENAGDNIYVFYRTMDDHARGQVEPKGEFFCKLRDPWMPEIQGLFHKEEIKN